MPNRANFAIAAFVATVFFAADLVASSVPVPVENLETAAYLGRWYQMYGSATVIYTMEVGGSCVIADYGTTNFSDVITVKNTVFPFGFEYSVSGYAVANSARAGELQVNLGPFADPANPKPYTSANYVVVGLGPRVSGQYDFALVTDPRMISLYVLARDPERFSSVYDASVLQQLEALGFTSWWNKPRRTNQEHCRRPAFEEEKHVRGVAVGGAEAITI
eukprot:TRINITY_DN52679_c0_g1_i1.p1 TRINITY_DN52679_c0_g1~~TRINITY_DN52679_c0_g1_i1.p1  ORF type:complete len:219 (-),score=29.42 TRINITY_DN52679_c0_g1_i1:97-753(-)